MPTSLDGMCFGDPLPPINETPEQPGAWRLDRDVPGVALWYTKDVGLYPAELRTPAAKNLYRKGRLLLACVRGKLN